MGEKKPWSKKPRYFLFNSNFKKDFTFTYFFLLYSYHTKQ